MIKINTISNHVAWYRYIKNPSKFIDDKIKNLNKRFKKYKKKKKIFCTLLLSRNYEIKKLNKNFEEKIKLHVLSFPFYNKKQLKHN